MRTGAGRSMLTNRSGGRSRRTPRLHRTRLAGAGGTHLVDGDADQHAPLLFHGAPVLVPVGMLTADTAVVVHQPPSRSAARPPAPTPRPGSSGRKSRQRPFNPPSRHDA